MNKGRGLLLGGAVVCFAAVTFFVVTGESGTIDVGLLKAFASLRSAGWNTAAEGLTYLGNWESIVIVCLLLLLYPQTRCTYGFPVSGVAIGTTLVKAILKPLVARARPDVVSHLIEQGGYSYPSGHAITSLAVFGLLFFLVWKNMENRRRARVLMAVLAVLVLGIGISRIYLGVHYPSDVLGGWCAGIVVTILVLCVQEKWEERASRQSEK